MERLSNILPGILRQRGLHGDISASLIVSKADQWLRMHLPAHALSLHVRKYDDGTIFIEAENSVALQEASRHAEEMVFDLRHDIAEPPIKGVRFMRMRNR